MEQLPEFDFEPTGALLKLVQKLLALRSAEVARESRRLSFQCNICDRLCTKRLVKLGREEPSCDRCQSSVRFRAIINVLSLELLGRSLCLSEFPNQPDIIG